MLARWLETLGQYSFDIAYKPGKDNTAADALSRRPEPTADVATQTESDECVRAIHCLDWSLSFIQKEQQTDAAIAEISEHLSRGQKPHKRVLKHSLSYLSQWEKLRLLGGVLYRVYRRRPFDDDQLQVVVPESLVQEVLASMHSGPSGGHFAPDKLASQIKLRMWWPAVLHDVKEFCDRCERCEARNAPIPAPRTSLGQLSASRPLEVVGMDILSGLPRTANGNKHLLVLVDHFSRWCEVYPLRDLTALSVAKVFVNEFISRFGVPSRIHSDHGGCFVGDVLSKTCELLGIERSRISSFHPMGNGMVERVNRTLLAMLSKYLETSDHDKWDEHLPLLMLGYRSQVHRSLGFSPYELIFGRHAKLPAEAHLDSSFENRSKTIAEYFDNLQSSLQKMHAEALKASNASHRKNKVMYEKKLNHFAYAVGDRVLLHRAVVPRGQYYKFIRPYKSAIVKAKVGDMNYRVQLEGSRRTILVHHNRLSPTAVKRRLLEPSAANDIVVTRDRDVLVNTGNQMLNVTHPEHNDTAEGSGAGGSRVTVPGTSQGTVSPAERLRGESEDRSAEEMSLRTGTDHDQNSTGSGVPSLQSNNGEPWLPVPVKTSRRSRRLRQPPDRYSPT